MAMGMAHLFGYRLCWNFNLPYLAPNIAEFWARWHISLSSWLRDYVFFPLGGSRGGYWRTCRNLMIVFGLCGLWHGAAWPFVVWGLSIGAWMCLHRAFRTYCQARPRLDALLRTGPGTALRVAATLFGFTLTLAIERTKSLADGLSMIAHLFLPQAGKRLDLSSASLVVLTAGLALGHLLAYRQRWRRLLESLPAPMRGLSYAATAVATLLLTPDPGTAFLYFQF
jgi:alginate O-acetyltransferase complex protein AlgI